MYHEHLSYTQLLGSFDRNVMGVASVNEVLRLFHSRDRDRVSGEDRKRRAGSEYNFAQLFKRVGGREHSPALVQLGFQTPCGSFLPIRARHDQKVAFLVLFEGIGGDSVQGSEIISG